jgi:hypothetical protein
MTTELLESKKLSDMTNEELYELQHSIYEIQIERMKINAEKLRKLFQATEG